MLSLNITSLFGYFLTFLLLYIAHRVLVRPYIILAPYRKLKHVRIRIRGRLLPNMMKNARDAVTKGDYYYDLKETIRADPDCRAIATVNGGSTNIHLIDPELLKEFYRHENLSYYKKRFGGGLLKMFLQDGLFSAEGTIWKKKRKIDSQAFHFEFVKKQVNLIGSIAKEFIGKIDPNEKLPAINFFQTITGEVVCRTFFGSNLSSQTFNGKSFCSIIADLIVDIAAESSTPMAVIFGKYYIKYFPSNKVKLLLKQIEEFKNICRSMVAERKNQFKQRDFSLDSDKDLLHLLLKYQQENPQENFDDDEIVHEFITFFMAGLDTTGHLLGMAAYYISRTPGVKQQLRDEIKSIFGADKGSISNVTFDNLNKLEYMLSVMNETLRLATPAPAANARIALKSHKIGEIPIPKGAGVMVPFIVNFSNAKYFDNPTEFYPDRWRNPAGRVMNSHPQHPFIFTPFSAGPRNCIGQHMAMLEAKIILVEFMRTFDFEVPQEYVLKMTRRFLYEPLEELKLNLRRI